MTFGSELGESKTSHSLPRRFSLKALFIVITLVGVVLGLREARRRDAVAIVARNDAVLDQIAKNLDALPANTTFKDSQFRANEFVYRSRMNPGVQATVLAQLFQSGRFNNETDLGVALDVSQAVAASSGNLVDQLINHYTTDFKQLDLVPGNSQLVTRKNHRRRITTWNLPGHNLLVIVDADVDLDDNTAQIIIHYRYRDQVSIW